jgi:chitodextrinase
MHTRWTMHFMSQLFGTARRRTAILGAVLMLTALGTGQAQMKQTIAIPAYFTPGAYWSQLDSSTPYVGIAVANVFNGPDYQVNSSYSSAIQAAQSAGIKVLGYVDTGYFGTTGQTTRLGASDTTSWLSQIELDVDAWYNFYGSSGLTGIFFDQAQNACGSGNAYANLYAQIYAYVKQNYPGALVIANPGTAVPQCYQNTADVLLTFEGSYLCYIQDPSCPQGDAYQALSWNPVDPRKLWHIIYGTTAAQLESADAQSRTIGVGYIDITSYGLPNPYDVLPTGSYWTALESATLPGGSVTTPSTPMCITSRNVSYTSATLSWPSSTDSGGRIVAYDLYQNGVWNQSVPRAAGNAQSVTVTGLLPNTQYTYTVVARDLEGNLSSASSPYRLTTERSHSNSPSAPGNVQALDVTYSSGTLSWSPSSGANHIAYYDIYNTATNAKMLTVPATTTSIVVGGLTPGTNNSFEIKARDTQGNVSPASASATFSTLALPGGLSVTNPSGTYTTAAIDFTADYLLPFAFQHVFIDTDDNAATGWVTASSPGPAIGADYMIENTSLYKYAGSGTDWAWTYIGAVSPTVNGYAVTWPVPLSLFTSSVPASIMVQYEGDGFAPTGNSAAVSLTQQ